MKNAKKINSRKLFLICLIVPMFFISSCNSNKEHVTAISNTKMNVFYIGVENPINIAVSGIDKEKLEVKIDKGTITGKDGNYIVTFDNAKDIGKAIITVLVDGKEIQKEDIRVKKVPDPVARIGLYSGGEISKEELLNIEKVEAVMENFDFDLRFKMIDFVFAYNDKGFDCQLPISGEKFSDKMKELISSFTNGQKFYIEEIHCLGPDGGIRKLPPLVFKIK